MRINFLLAVILFTPFLATAQTPVVDDFEGSGTITTWFGDDCGLNTGLDNPVSSEDNNSATVLEYHDVGGQYANVRFQLGSNFDLSENHTFALKIYIPASGLTGSQTNQISLKLQDGTLGQPWTTQSEIIKPLVLDQWQTVTFDFANDAYLNLDESSPPPTQRTDFNRVVLQVNGENNNDHVLAYLDDFQYDGTVEEVDVVIPELPVFDELVWADEFDGNGAVDGQKWFHQTQLPAGGSWYNGEVQHYTNREENSFQDQGMLNIVLRKESFTDQGHTKEFTSARLNSKFAFTYGRVEVRAKLPSGAGTWPAIWMLGKNVNEDGGFWDNQGFGTTGWPAAGEIDIMEHWGNNQNFVQSATHTPSSYGATINHGGRSIPTVSSAFHVYSMDWSEDVLVFSVDDVVHYTYNPSVKNADTWPFDKEMYILLNIAAQANLSSAYTQGTMEVDYVRVYQEEPAVTDLGDEALTKVAVYPNPVEDAMAVQLPEGSHGQALLTLYNREGQRIAEYARPIYNQQVIVSGMDKLAPGLYFLSAQFGSQQVMLKVMKK